MLYTLIVIMAAGLLPAALFYEKKENRKGLLPAKTSLSLLFVLSALIQPPAAVGTYRLFLLAGLVLCLLGDVCLVFRQKKMFLAGLVSFLLGHVFYILAFFQVTRFGMTSCLGAVVIFLAGAGIYIWLRPHLGAMRPAVFFYSAVISAMLSAAWSVWSDSGLEATGRWMIFGGALCFYISDIFVARDRFLKKDFFNRLLGLPLYYSGQFLLAFSAGFLR